MTLFMFACIVACSSSEEEAEPAPKPSVHEPAVSYIQFDLASGANQVTGTAEGGNAYTFRTMGEDPYAYTQRLASDIPEDSTVLTFEYRSSAELSLLQFFFCDPVTEERSLKTAPVPARDSWTTYSINLSAQRKAFSWGRSGHRLRFDFGTDKDVTFSIRKIYFRGMNEAERAEEEERRAEEERLAGFSKNLEAYLSASYGAVVQRVQVGADQVSVEGECPAGGSYVLCEVTPYEDVTEQKRFPNRTPLSGGHFSVTFERHTQTGGVGYDRLLSRWAIAEKVSETEDRLVSHAHYADEIHPRSSLPEQVPAHKKGLGGFFINQVESDLDDLGIGSVTVNVPLTSFTYSTGGNNRLSHEYEGKTYYFDSGYVSGLDQTLRSCQRRSIVVAAIILVSPTASDASLTPLFRHPQCTGGFYSMPNMTTAESTRLYAAAMDFLMSRYTRPDGMFGRIHHLIVHNEVDAGMEWTNMGRDMPVLVYLDTYVKSMRLCYNIARSYDPNVQVLASFTNSWTHQSQPGEGYASKTMLGRLVDYSNAEGDYRWGVAYHSYPQDLTRPDTWNDTQAIYSSASPYVTFKNLEVIDQWVRQKDILYKGKEKRLLWLSENGTNSPSYSDTDLALQAAGAAWGLKKIAQLDGIDAIQWHNWIDNRTEFGLRIGLRRFPDDTESPLGPKPVWYLYQAWGTQAEDEVFDQYLPVIGIGSWENFIHTVN